MRTTEATKRKRKIKGIMKKGKKGEERKRGKEEESKAEKGKNSGYRKNEEKDKV